MTFQRPPSKRREGGSDVADVISSRARTIEPSVTLSLNTRANELKERGDDVVGLTAGEPDFDTPDRIKKAAIKALGEGKTKYTPAAGISPLRKAVAEAYTERLGVPYSPKEVVISHGAKHSIYNALFTLVDPGDEVMVLSPYWTSYPEMVKIVGGRPRIVEIGGNTGYKLTVERLKKELGISKPRALLFNSPNNPSSVVYAKDELQPIADLLLEERISLISDEIYEDLTFGEWKHYSPVSLVPELKAQTVVISGVSKGYAMTGWRLGFALADERVAYRMAAFQAHATGCPNAISQWAAIEAILHGADDRERMRVEFEKRKVLFGERLKKIDSISFPEPGGGFYYLVDVSAYYDRCGVSSSDEFCEKLLEEVGLVLIPGGAFGVDNMVRFSFAAGEKELNGALERFERFLASHAG
jgi:aspartate aminotransferase